MYAIKEAVIAKEHSKNGLDTAIFYMDMRTYGKEFERYYDRAKNETGVRFIRSRIHSIGPAGPGSEDLRLEYADENGHVREEVFDMVVLSVGLEVSKDVVELAGRIGVNVDASGFASSSDFAPVETSRPGIFACGAFSGPKDIPYSVMEASAASAVSAALLADSRDFAHQGEDLSAGKSRLRPGTADRYLRLSLRHQYRKRRRRSRGPGVRQDTASCGLCGRQPVHVQPGHPEVDPGSHPGKPTQPGRRGRVHAAHP